MQDMKRCKKKVIKSSHGTERKQVERMMVAVSDSGKSGNRKEKKSHKDGKGDIIPE